LNYSGFLSAFESVRISVFVVVTVRKTLVGIFNFLAGVSGKIDACCLEPHYS